MNDKKMVLEWRNHPSIKKWMFSQEIINLESHLDYISTLETRKDKVYLLVKQNSQAIGVIDFTNIDYKNKRAEIGIYANPNIKGVGNILMENIVRYASDVLKVDTLVSEVFEDNMPAISLYRRYHFRDIGTA